MCEQRRQNLYDAIKGDCAALNGGMSTVRYNTDRDMPFRQEGMFYYFTECEEANCVVVFDGAAKQTHLFFPDLDDEYALWYGEVVTLD